MTKLVGGRDPSKVSLAEFQEIFKGSQMSLEAYNPKTWTFPGSKRDENGNLSTVELAEILKDAIDSPAGAFGANGSPPSLKVSHLFRSESDALTYNRSRLSK